MESEGKEGLENEKMMTAETENGQLSNDDDGIDRSLAFLHAAALSSLLAETSTDENDDSDKRH